MRDKSASSGLRVAKTEIDTLAKLTPLKETAKFYYALFSGSGFDEKIVAEAPEKQVQLYSLSEIVQSNKHNI